MRIFSRLVIPLLLLAPVAFAQQPKNRMVIHAGHLLDVKAGRMLANQNIVVEDDCIVSVGSAAAPGGVKVIDLGNATVLPGLIDAHTHLTFRPTDLGMQALAISVPREALAGARNARVTLQAGFTTVRNVGANGYSDIALRDAINAGDVPGPHIVASGPALGITAATATMICCLTAITPPATAWPTAFPPCSTARARSSSMART